MANAFSYLRLGPAESEDAAGIVQQKRESEEFFHGTLESKGVVWRGHFIDDPSAGTKPLRDRPEGRRMCRDLQNGDHLIFCTYHRSFESSDDFVTSFQSWGRKQVVLSLLDFGLHEIGEQHLRGLELVARMAKADLSRRAERARAAHAARKAGGRAKNQFPGYGFKFTGPRGRLRRVPDPQEREAMAEIVRLRNAGKSWREIDVEFMRRRIRRRNGKSWHLSSIAKAYAVELRLRKSELQGKTKRCSACSVYLALSNFHRNAHSADGYHSVCRTCRGKRRAELRLKQRKQRRTASVDEFQKSVRKGHSPTGGVCGKAIEHLGGVDGFAKGFVEAFHDSKPGSQKRVSLAKAAVRLMMLGSRSPANEIDLPGDSD
jgi:DNA invertase Pin-like site-specific DNA recombinase